MNVDVTTRTDIADPLSSVAAFASEPDNAPRWYVNIKSVEWQTPRPISIGSRFAFVAQFLGRRLEYIYQVVEYVPDKRLVMRTSDGSVPDGDDVRVGADRYRHSHDASKSRHAVRLLGDCRAIHVGSDAASESQGSRRAESPFGS